MEMCQWCFDAVHSAQTLERLIGLAACFRADRGESYQQSDLFAEARKAWLARYLALGGDPSGLPADLDAFLGTLSGDHADGVRLSDFSTGELVSAPPKPVASETQRPVPRRKARQEEVLFPVPNRPKTA